MHQLLSLLVFLSAFFSFVFCSSDYHEQLLLRPLPTSLLLASFNFQSNTSFSAFEQQNFQYFPRSLGQILQHANTRELHLRFSLGRWDAERWGARPWGGAKEGGTGVELWAWVEAETDEEADGRWLTLTNALSGLFCASLNFIDSTRTIRPVMSFQPAGDHSNSTLSNLHLLHGTLPREVVCTENLTPFLKLLPCKGKAGISSLLDGHKLFDASWQSDPIPRPVPVEQLHCDQSKPYNSHDTCYPVDSEWNEEGWTISEIFGHTLKGSCPIAKKGEDPVCIAVPHSRDVYTSAGAHEHKDETGFMRCFELAPEADFEMVLPYQETAEQSPLEQPLLYAERSFIGYGQERGGVQSILTNPSPTEAVDFVYMETLPWFMKLYLHTLKVRINGTDAGDVIEEMYYRPALDRKRGTQLEIRMQIPANSKVVLTYDFEKAILRYTEYPPDANRGFDIAPAVITIGNVSIRTTSLLLPLPTPDFSMPYNVIILTSTVMALAFGMIFNLLIRRLVAADEADQWDVKAVRLRVAATVKRLAQRFNKKEEKFEKKE
ncbi:hypothetical protein B7463_g6144, partial [Scytalidium lignicola]